jgi:hypothetical protein
MKRTGDLRPPDHIGVCQYQRYFPVLALPSLLVRSQPTPIRRHDRYHLNAEEERFVKRGVDFANIAFSAVFVIHDNGTKRSSSALRWYRSHREGFQAMRSWSMYAWSRPYLLVSGVAGLIAYDSARLCLRLRRQASFSRRRLGGSRSEDCRIVSYQPRDTADEQIRPGPPSLRRLKLACLRRRRHSREGVCATVQAGSGLSSRERGALTPLKLHSAHTSTPKSLLKAARRSASVTPPPLVIRR